MIRFIAILAVAALAAFAVVNATQGAFDKIKAHNVAILQ